MMTKSVEELLDEGVTLKRQGEFDAAIKAYEAAINIDPAYTMSYMSLGKVAYLAGKHDLAIRSYLAAMHLELATVEEQIANNALPEDLMIMKSSVFTTDQLGQLPARSAFIIFLDSNTPRHFAHAFIDLNPNLLESVKKDVPEIDGFVELYYAQILGDGSHQEIINQGKVNVNEQMQVEESIYIKTGQDLFFNYIRWEYVGSKDVLSLYFT